jgi:hypothetical protein
VVVYRFYKINYNLLMRVYSKKGEFKPLSKVWSLTQIRNIYRRRYLMKYQCVLIEMENNTSKIFNFVDGQLEYFLQLISKKQKSRQ